MELDWALYTITYSLHTVSIPMQMKNTFMIIDLINSAKIILHAVNYREVSTALLQQYD